MFNYTKDNWKRKGLFFGFWLFLFNALLLFGTKQLPFTIDNIVFHLIIWIAGGQIYGYFAYRWQGNNSK